jgi:hypothetical protein
MSGDMHGEARLYDVRMDTGALETASEEMTRSGGDFAAVVDRLGVRLTGLGLPSTNDDFSWLNNVAAECLALGLDALTHAGGVAAGSGREVAGMAATVREADAAVSERVRDIGNDARWA